MVCAKCDGKSEETSKCVLKALDTIKEHFLMMRGLCVENANTINSLKQHNDKLHNTIDLLQQQKEQRCKSSPKRRRFSPKKSQEKQQQRLNSLPQIDSPKVPESQNSLNMNIALQPDDEDEEAITETEPPISPYNPWATRRKFNKLNCENKRPESTIKTDKKNDWLCKVTKDSVPVGKTKMSLTLRSNSPRLKQTRLHFDANKNNNDGSDKDVIESSPNLYIALKQAKQSRSLLQRPDSNNVLDANSTASTSTKSINNNQPVFDMDDDDSFFDLCPDPTAPKSQLGGLPPLSGSSDTSSVMMLTPATQEIVFIDDSIEETNQPLNTMDFMAEAIKEDDKVSMTRLQKYEAKLIKEQKMAAANVKPATPTNIKVEQMTEQPSGMGNESTKLPEDFEIEEDEEEVEEQTVPRPIVIKQEHEPSMRELYNIQCEQCEKFINFMSANMTDAQIREYLCNCRHFDQRELDNNTPDGFWNPHLVSFAEDDPRSKVHVDRRFVNQRKK